MATKTKRIDKSVTDGVITFKAVDGDQAFSFKCTDFPDEIRLRAEEHGYLQKFGDVYAGEPDVDKAFELLEAMHGRMTAGDWKAARMAGEGGGGGYTLLAEAVARLKGVTPAEARKALDGKTDDEVAAIKTNARVKQIVGEIQGERLAARNAKLAEEAAKAADFAL